jgi:hypothetical protein
MECSEIIFDIISSIITLAAVIVALFIGTSTLSQNNKIQRNQYKYKQLKEIADWAISINSCDMEIEIPWIDMTRIDEMASQGLPEKSIDELRQNVMSRFNAFTSYQLLMSYGKALSMSEYIKAITRKTFKEELFNKVVLVEFSLVGLMFIKSRQEGMTYESATAGFRLVYIDIAKNIEEQIQKDKKSLDDLFTKYAEKNADNVNQLLTEIANNIDNLN